MVSNFARVTDVSKRYSKKHLRRSIWRCMKNMPLCIYHYWS